LNAHPLRKPVLSILGLIRKPGVVHYLRYRGRKRITGAIGSQGSVRSNLRAVKSHNPGSQYIATITQAKNLRE